MDFQNEEKSKWSFVTIIVIVVIILGVVFFLTFEAGVKTGRVFTHQEKLEILNKLAENKNDIYSELEKVEILKDLSKNTDKSITAQEKIDVLNSLK